MSARRRREFARAALIAALATVFAGCAVGPDYKAPDMHAPERFAETPDSAAGAPPEADDRDAALSRWWQQFQDAELQSLITRAFESNLDLQTAASRIREARAQEIIAGAAGLPNVNATGLGAYLHSNSNPFGSLGSTSDSGDPAGAAGTRSTSMKLFSAGFDATWEIDVFGGTRRAAEATRAASEAAEWQFRDAQVSLSAEIAVDYLNLCATRTRMAVVRDAIERQQQVLDLTEARRRAGFVTELDVNQQRTQLASTQAQLPALDAESRTLVHALSVLLAIEPGSLADELGGARQMPDVPLDLPPALPSDLLRRRPDVRAAERELASATAEVGVAVADLYPRFDLLGAANLASDSLADLASRRSLSRIGAGLIRWPVFQGGRGRAAVRVSEEQQTQAFLAYKKTVLASLQETEDALARFDGERQKLMALLDAQAAAASSLDVAQAQYRHGAVTFLNVLDANTALLSLEDQVAQSRMSVAQSRVSLYKAIGGGWR